MLKLTLIWSRSADNSGGSAVQNVLREQDSSIQHICFATTNMQGDRLCCRYQTQTYRGNNASGVTNLSHCKLFLQGRTTRSAVLTDITNSEQLSRFVLCSIPGWIHFLPWCLSREKPWCFQSSAAK